MTKQTAPKTATDSAAAIDKVYTEGMEQIGQSETLQEQVETMIYSGVSALTVVVTETVLNKYGWLSTKTLHPSFYDKFGKNVDKVLEGATPKTVPDGKPGKLTFTKDGEDAFKTLVDEMKKAYPDRSPKTIEKMAREIVESVYIEREDAQNRINSAVKSYRELGAGDLTKKLGSDSSLYQTGESYRAAKSKFFEAGRKACVAKYRSIPIAAQKEIDDILVKMARGEVTYDEGITKIVEKMEPGKTGSAKDTAITELKKYFEFKNPATGETVKGLYSSIEPTKSGFDQEIKKAMSSIDEHSVDFHIVEGSGAYEKVGDLRSQMIKRELTSILRRDYGETGRMGLFDKSNSHINDLCQRWGLTDDTRRAFHYIARLPDGKRNQAIKAINSGDIAFYDPSNTVINGKKGVIEGSKGIGAGAKKTGKFLLRIGAHVLVVGGAGCIAYLALKDDPTQPLPFTGKAEDLSVHGISSKHAHLFTNDAIKRHEALLIYLNKTGALTDKQLLEYRVILNDKSAVNIDFQISFRNALEEAYGKNKDDMIALNKKEAAEEGKAIQGAYRRGLLDGQKAKNGTQGGTGDADTQEGTDLQGGSGGFGMLRKYSRGPVEEETLPIVPKNNREIV